MNFRQIHLDFHTSEKIEKIEVNSTKAISKYAEAWAYKFNNAFSKCHHGWAYHESEANEMHPGLSFDLYPHSLRLAERLV